MFTGGSRRSKTSSTERERGAHPSPPVKSEYVFRMPVEPPRRQTPNIISPYSSVEVKDNEKRSSGDRNQTDKKPSLERNQTDKKSSGEESKQQKAATREKERQTAREEAQARARLKSDDELGVTSEFVASNLQISNV